MNLSESIDLLGVNLRCTICLNIVDNPISLPCNHFFCQCCIEELCATTTATAKAINETNKNQNISLDTSACKYYK